MRARLRPSRASPSIAVAEHDALVAGGAHGRLGGAERVGRPRDQLVLGDGEHRIAGLRRFVARDRRARVRRRRARRAGSARRRRARRPASWDRARSGPSRSPPGSSPGTSEIASVTTRAGCARDASRPPLMRERCLRTVFISPMLAPERNSARVTACLSAKRQSVGGRDPVGRCAARHQHQHQIVCRRALGELERALRRRRAPRRPAPDARPRSSRSGGWAWRSRDGPPQCPVRRSAATFIASR